MIVWRYPAMALIGLFIGGVRLARVLLPVLLLAVVQAVPALASDLFTSFEAPPATGEIKAATAAGIIIFDFDLDGPGAEASVRAIKQAGGKIAAYHIGGGGGRAWGSVRTGEWVRRYDSPRDFVALTQDVRDLVARGADFIHFDNTHRFSGRRLEAIADAIIKGGAGFVAKNNPSKWLLTMRRRPDLKPAYAVIEDALFDLDATQKAYGLFARGVPVYIVGFRRPIEPQAQPVTDDYAQAYADNNPWAKVLLMEDERAFDSRAAVWIKPKAAPR